MIFCQNIELLDIEIEFWHLVFWFKFPVTEEEIREGIINDKNPANHCLAFIRDIDHINLQHPKAWRFQELIGQESDARINTETQELLNHVRNDLIPTTLPEENIHMFKTVWTDNDGINENDNQEYLQEFCDTFEKSVLRLIDKATASSSDRNERKEMSLYSEVLEHSHQCVKKTERFVGRQDLLDMVNSYVMSTCDKPLVLCGESGSGKTSVMAKLATEVNEYNIV